MGLLQLSKNQEKTILTSRAMGLAISASMGLFMAAVTTTGMLSDALLILAIIMAIVAASNAIRDAFEWAKPNVILGAALAIGAVVAIIGAMVLARKGLQGALGGMGDVGGAGAGAAETLKKQRAMKASTADWYDSGGTYMGGRMYDMGGPTTEHGTAILQKGETVVPKTRNMLEGGLTLNIGGDIVTDNGDDFAERIAAVLPEALRRQSDIGGI